MLTVLQLLICADLTGVNFWNAILWPSTHTKGSCKCYFLLTSMYPVQHPIVTPRRRRLSIMFIHTHGTLSFGSFGSPCMPLRYTHFVSYTVSVYSEHMYTYFVLCHTFKMQDTQWVCHRVCKLSGTHYVVHLTKSSLRWLSISLHPPIPNHRSVTWKRTWILAWLISCVRG